MFNDLVELYQNSIKSFPDRSLFGVKRSGAWHWMTYREFSAQVDATRAALAGLGVSRDDRVSVICNNRPEWAVGAYATYGLAAAYVPMYEAQLDKEWQYILADCGAKVLFVASAAIRDRIGQLRKSLPALKHVIVFDGDGDAQSMAFKDLLAKGRDKTVECVCPDPSAVAGFIYTSGTTGKPKGVLLTHSNLAKNVSAMHEVFPILSEDRSLSFLPWAHSFGQTVELHCLFSHGASMGIAESVDKIVANLAEVRPTLLFSVPRIFNRIYDGLHKKMAEDGGLKKKLFYASLANEALRRKLAAEGKRSGWADFKHGIYDKLVFSKVRARFGGRLKYAFSGGAALSKEVAEFIDSLGIMVYEGYGLTETSPVATANRPGSRKIGSIGRPIPGVDVRIDTSVASDGKQGEIIVYGHNVMKGYHNLPEENAKVFTADGGFRTGDLGYKDDDGFVYITGRIKEQYKLENGKYVAPAPLEEKLKLSPFIANIMIYGDNKPYNVALIVPDLDAVKRWASENGRTASDIQALLADPTLREALGSELEKYSAEFKQFEKIRRFELIPEDFTTQNDMLTPSLKLKRRKVMERFGKEIEQLYV